MGDKTEEQAAAPAETPFDLSNQATMETDPSTIPDPVAPATPEVAAQPVPQEAPAQAQEEPEFDLKALLGEDNLGYIDQNLRSQLEKDAAGQTTLPQVIALAGLAAANPEMAAHVMRQKQVNVQGARNTLTSLSQQAEMFKRQMLVQDQRDKTTRDMVEKARVGEWWKTYRAHNKALEGGELPEGLQQPTVGDEGSLQEYITMTQPVIGQMEREKVAVGAAEDSLRNSIRMMVDQDVGDPATFAQEAVESVMAATGWDETRAAQYVGAQRFEQQALASMQRKEAEEAKIKAHTKLYAAKSAALGKQQEKIDQQMELATTASIREAFRLVGAMEGEYRSVALSLGEAQADFDMWASAGMNEWGGTKWYSEKASEKASNVAKLQALKAEMESGISIWRQKLALHEDKIVFGETFTTIMDQTSMTNIANHPEYKDNPQGFFDMLSTPLMPTGDPTYDAQAAETKIVFWGSFLAPLMRLYPDMSPQDMIVEAEKYLVQQAQRFYDYEITGDPSLLLSPVEENQAWLAGERILAIAADAEAARAARMGDVPASSIPQAAQTWGREKVGEVTGTDKDIPPKAGPPKEEEQKATSQLLEEKRKD